MNKILYNIDCIKNNKEWFILMEKFDDGNIQIQYSDENEPCVLELMNQVLIAYETITSIFKLKNYNKKITIYLYNSIEELHNDVFGEKKEEWKVAFNDKKGNLKLVTPLNPGNIHSYSTILKIAQKCVADIILADNFEDIPKWLDITTYLFGLYDAKTTFAYRKLNICNVTNFSDAYFITLSLINTYGINKIIKLYKKAKNYNKILNASDKEINNKIFQYFAEVV